MPGPFKPGTPAAFFYEWAGTSYVPGVETMEQGKRRGASALADAERMALDAPLWHYNAGHSNTMTGMRLKIDEATIRALRAALDAARRDGGEG